MDEFSYFILLDAQAAMVRVEAMKAENAAFIARGEHPPHNGEEFLREAANIADCANSMRARAG